MAEPPSHPTPEHACPFCRTKFNRAGFFESAEPPTPGSFVICINCGAILRFDENLIAQKLDTAALEILVNDPDFAAELGQRRQQILRMNAHFKLKKHADN